LAATGGAGKRQSERDKARAAYMKRQGITRETGRCCNCYRIIKNGSHINNCQ
jgi:hypothetical protein